MFRSAQSKRPGPEEKRTVKTREFYSMSFADATDVQKQGVHGGGLHAKNCMPDYSSVSLSGLEENKISSIIC